jgi:REP element-mobilizing transposase RayT
VKPYPLAQDLLRPVQRVAMPRALRLYAPGGTVHVVARCNSRDFFFTTPEDFEAMLSTLRGMIRTYEVTLYTYTLMSNHVYILLQVLKLNALGRPLRWFITESARTFHRARGRRGHF